MAIICGIDEAGKGPVIGPLVLAGFCLDEKDLSKLDRLRVKESKLLTTRQRKFLFKKLKEIAHSYKIVKVPAAEIDSRAAVGLNLNQLEALKAAEIVDKLKPGLVYVDSPISPKAEKFGLLIKGYMKSKKKPKIISEHKADVRYKIVAAASILAKETRELEIEQIKKETGEEFGSGYPSDPVCQAFMKKHWTNAFAKYIRKSWETFKRAKAEKEQSKLGEFG